MKNELVIEHKLEITSNMEALEAQIQADIEKKYNLVVTDDTVANTKKLMAEVNKDKDAFEKTYKEFKAAVFEPFSPLDEAAKRIKKHFDDARTALGEQVRKFEETKRAQAKEVCIACAKAECEAKKIDFEAITISDLFEKLGSITATGTISGPAKKEINQRIEAVELVMLRAKLEAEEQAKKEREIAEKARIEAEEKARIREANILKQAEIDKQKAVDDAIKAKEEADRLKKEELDAIEDAAAAEVEVIEAPEPQQIPIYKPANVLSFPKAPEILDEEEARNEQAIQDVIDGKVVPAGVEPPEMETKYFWALGTQKQMFELLNFMASSGIEYGDMEGK